MEKLENFFDKDTVENISNLVESKMNILKDIPDFKEKDRKLASYMEEIDENLPEDMKEKFDEMVRLNYQLEDYYFTLAYLLGSKYGKSLENI